MTLWIRHPITKAIAQVPEAALPIYRQSGWDLLPDKDVDELHRAAAAEVVAAEQAMRNTATPTAPAGPEPAPEPAPEPVAEPVAEPVTDPAPVKTKKEIG